MHAVLAGEDGDWLEFIVSKFLAISGLGSSTRIALKIGHLRRLGVVKFFSFLFHQENTAALLEAKQAYLLANMWPIHRCLLFA